MKRLIVPVALMFNLLLAGIPVLDTAHELADGVFEDWNYGAYSTENRHLDCTTFISALADTLLSRRSVEYTPQMRRAVLIGHTDLNRDVIREGPDTLDPRYAGIVHMLEQYGQGRRIEDLSEVGPGDFIQYWIRRSNGTWFGHASVIETVRYDPGDGHYKARIFGAHKSTNGIAVSKFELLLSAKNRYVYIGRLSE
jgi:hypothetical protein